MIKVFKLINGEELIADVSSSSDSGYHLDNAANIVLQPTDSGISVGLAPYMPYVDGKIYLNKSAIASEGEPAVEMRNEYSSRFGTGIQIANVMP